MSSTVSPPSRSRFVPFLLGALACAGLVGAAWAWNAGQVSQAQENVARVIANQQEAWNAGDLDEFMRYYADDVAFFSGGNVLEGKAKLAERYRKRYQTDGKAMGTLTFTDLSVQPVDRTFTYATGRWKVVMKNETPHGLFTILLRNTPDGWRIIHDHTSAADPPKSP